MIEKIIEPTLVTPSYRINGDVMTTITNSIRNSRNRNRRRTQPDVCQMHKI